MKCAVVCFVILLLFNEMHELLLSNPAPGSVWGCGEFSRGAKRKHK